MAVHTHTDSDFQQILSAHSSVAVKYFADWCGSCKLLAPKFKRISNEEDKQNIYFAEINAEHSPEARKLAGVNNLPFVAVFKNGQLVEGIATSSEEYIKEMLSKIS